jgi:nicotinate-nucleotide--dimethylbenzimidazole phosphoribosyltransferase
MVGEPSGFIRDLERIEPLSTEAQDRAKRHLDSLTKPVGSLGRLEDAAVKLAGIQGNAKPSVDRKAVYVFAADHGITAEGVSAYPSDVTQQMVLNFLNGGAAINVLARHVGAKVHVVDVGVNGDLNHPLLVSRKVRRGSRNFLREAAMTQEELQSAWEVGADQAESAYRDGIQIVAPGEMGIGNTCAASAITSALTGQPAEAVTGPGTGVGGEALRHKQDIVQRSVAMHFPEHAAGTLPDALEVLRCLGGLEIAAMAGFIHRAAYRKLTIVIDGFISTAAAAVACSIAPPVWAYLFAGHRSEEPGHRALLTLLRLHPLLELGMRLGEGTGAVLAFSLLEAAVRIYREMATFDSAGVSGAISQ